jgi:hypothetical protein
MFSRPLELRARDPGTPARMASTAVARRAGLDLDNR